MGILPSVRCRLHLCFCPADSTRSNGFYHGRKTIVPFSAYSSEEQNATNIVDLAAAPVLRPFLPYHERLEKPCYLDVEGTTKVPQISAYAGLPQGMAAPSMGSQDEISLAKVCFDRIGRLSPYGWGYAVSDGGLGIGLQGDNEGIENVEKVDYRNVNWHLAQERCLATNAAGLELRKIPRQALILRSWHDFHYTPHHIMILRAIINELSIGSGGEYVVHFLIHVRDETLPIWDSAEVYNRTLHDSLPAEFRGMGTLWSEPQMRLVYPPPFPDSFENMSGGDIYGAYRSLHFPLQYFASKHDYDYYWNWEMDVRVIGHYYELLDRVSSWANRQPRRYLWERSSRFYIPEFYNNSYQAFSDAVEHTTRAKPVSGPQTRKLLAIPQSRFNENEITDLITFSPIFDPHGTKWIFGKDVTGYDTKRPVPSRRASLITVTRLSARLLKLMHGETSRFHHTMFPEMYPASVALHYGLKAVYVPMPIYFDRLWTADTLQQTFNPGPEGSSGGSEKSAFGPREHVFRGSSCYSNANFAGALWRRWLGQKEENGEGGPQEEVRTGSTGRMCLRSMMLHPIKSDV